MVNTPIRVNKPSFRVMSKVPLPGATVYEPPLPISLIGELSDNVKAVNIGMGLGTCVPEATAVPVNVDIVNVTDDPETVKSIHDVQTPDPPRSVIDVCA